LRIVEVTPNSPAAAAGLRPDDRIERFNGYSINGPRNFRAIVIAARNPVAVSVRRKGVAKRSPLARDSQM
jgi:S1-C subfamily serine protease